MNPLEMLKNLNPRIKEIVEFPISAFEDIGFQCVIYLDDGHPYSGGQHKEREMARRIALAEAFERAIFEKITIQPHLAQEFMIEKFPDTSGFAAGFDSQSTQARSFAEGLERWARSTWWDNKLKMGMVSAEVPEGLSESAHFLLKQFDSYLFLSQNIEYGKSVFTYGLFLGFKDKGVFAGSRVVGAAGDIWTHATIEALRNLKSFSQNEANKYTDQQEVLEKLNYFGTHGDLVKQQVVSFENSVWPKPELLMQKQAPSMPGVYVWRTLFKDYVPFNLHPLERFVF